MDRGQNGCRASESLRGGGQGRQALRRGKARGRTQLPPPGTERAERPGGERREASSPSPPARRWRSNPSRVLWVPSAWQKHLSSGSPRCARTARLGKEDGLFQKDTSDERKAVSFGDRGPRRQVRLLSFAESHAPSVQDHPRTMPLKVRRSCHYYLHGADLRTL